MQCLISITTTTLDTEEKQELEQTGQFGII